MYRYAIRLLCHRQCQPQQCPTHAEYPGGDAHQYWNHIPRTALPFWMHDRKALALYRLGHYRHAFYEKLLALAKAPTQQAMWNILKVLIKWLWYTPFRIMNKFY